MSGQGKQQGGPGAPYAWVGVGNEEVCRYIR